MTKNAKIFGLLLLAAVAYFGLKYYIRPFSPERFLEEVRNSAEPAFASLNRQIQAEDYLRYKLDSLIESKSFEEAKTVLDTSKLSSSSKMDYQGKIAFAQGDLEESLDFFNQALGSDSIYSVSFANRAKVYTEMRMYEKALSDYRTIASYNYDFNLQIARVFELMKEKDSAIKYYELYLKHYPENKSAADILSKLKNGG